MFAQKMTLKEKQLVLFCDYLHFAALNCALNFIIIYYTVGVILL